MDNATLANQQQRRAAANSPSASGTRNSIRPVLLPYGTTRSNMPLGRDPFAPPTLTPGPLGHNDSASPSSRYTVRGITPGPLGVNDYAEPAISSKRVIDGPRTITGDVVREVVPGLGDRATSIARDLNKAVMDAGITTLIGQAMFIAQVAHESDGFSKMKEVGGTTVFNSRTLQKKSYSRWKNERTHDPDEKTIDYFFFMYDKDSPSPQRQRVARLLGNTEPGDGARYCGRGYIQLTGREGYRKAGHALGLDLENNPELAMEPTNAARIAGWFWKMKGLNRFTKSDSVENFRTITLRINGGYNGLEDRTARYKRAKKALDIDGRDPR